MAVSPAAEPPPSSLPVSAALVLQRAQIEALIAILGPKKGSRFVRVMVETLASEETLSEVSPIRGSAQVAEMRRAQIEAGEVFFRWLPTFRARLSRE